MRIFFSGCIIGITYFQSSQKRTYTYPRCTEVIDFIKLDGCIDLMIGFKQFFDLIHGYSVKTAAERVQLN